MHKRFNCSGSKTFIFLRLYRHWKIRIKKNQTNFKWHFKGCKLSDCKLIGGETAEMPGVYSKDKFDIAGFSVGIVSKKKF